MRVGWRELEREGEGSRERKRKDIKRPTGGIEGRGRLDFAEWWSGWVLGAEWSVVIAQLIAQRQRDRVKGRDSECESLCFKVH